MAANTCIILNQKADGTGVISMRIGNTSVSVCFEELVGQLNEFGDPKIALTESNLDCVNLSIQTYTANPWRYESTPELIGGAIEGCIEELLRQQEEPVIALRGSSIRHSVSGPSTIRFQAGPNRVRYMLRKIEAGFDIIDENGVNVLRIDRQSLFENQTCEFDEIGDMNVPGMADIMAKLADALL